MIRKLHIAPLIIMTIFLFVRCKNPIHEKLSLIKNWRINFEDTTTIAKPTVKTDAAEGSSYNHLVAENPFGKGLVYELPDSLVGEDIRIYIQGFVRVGAKFTGNVIAVTLQKGDSVFHWQSFNTDDYINKTNIWQSFSDSTQLPVWTNSVKGAKLAVYGFKSGKRSFMDLDDLRITLKRVDFIKK